jgi:hypothetical protein
LDRKWEEGRVWEEIWKVPSLSCDWDASQVGCRCSLENRNVLLEWFEE